MFLFLLCLYIVLVLCFFPAAVADRSVAVYLVVDYHGINFFEPLYGGVVTPHFEIMVEDESRITLYFHHPVGGGSHPILKSWWKMNHESPSIFIILLEEGVLAPFWNPLTPFCHKRRGGPFSIRNHIVQVAMTLDLCISFPVSISEGRGTPNPHLIKTSCSFSSSLPQVSEQSLFLFKSAQSFDRNKQFEKLVW